MKTREAMFNGPALTVLNYHHVGDRPRDCSLWSLTIPPGQFARQMEWLSRSGYHTITTVQWLRWRNDREPLPSKPVMLTFDDAYADIETLAIPVMERYGFIGVIYAITRLAGGRTPWDGMRTMSCHQLRHCASLGFEIGAHTRTHPDLSMLSATQHACEIAGSKEDLERAGLPAISFSHPYGKYSKATVESVQSSFSIAFIGREGRNTFRTDPVQMRRTMVLPCDTMLDFALRVKLGWSPLGRVGGLLRRGSVKGR